jgi:hypothetical protein
MSMDGPIEIYGMYHLHFFICSQSLKHLPHS